MKTKAKLSYVVVSTTTGCLSYLAVCKHRSDAVVFAKEKFPLARPVTSKDTPVGVMLVGECDLSYDASSMTWIGVIAVPRFKVV